MNLFRLKAVHIYNSRVCFITSCIFQPLPFQLIALHFNPTDHFSSMLIFKNIVQCNSEENKELNQTNRVDKKDSKSIIHVLSLLLNVSAINVAVIVTYRGRQSHTKLLPNST